MPEADKKATLRVLLLEDNAADAELIGLVLRRAGYHCEIVRVETREEFESALERGSYDVVLADSSLPAFDGVTALQIARVLVPDVPFVFVSGTMGEELAIEMLKLGATDYVLKQRMSRLGPAVGRAITEAAERRGRREAEKAKSEAELLFRVLFEQMVVGVAVTDLAECVLTANPALERMLGYHSGALSRLRLSELTYPEDQLAGAEQLVELGTGNRRSYEVDKRFVRRDGMIRWTHVVVSVIRDESGAPRYLVNVIDDITDRKTMEQRFVHAQKMEVVGRMAAGFAHDFNNLLTVINGYSQLLLERTPQQDPSRRDLQEIRGAGERATTLTQRMLTFGQHETQRANVLDLNAVISGLEHLLRRLGGEQIKVTTKLRSGIGLLEADQVQMEQIIINLAINARDAMPEGGELVIETEQVSLDAKTACEVNLKAGKFVALTVADSGHGMDEATKALIFEPFFTTKEVGKGTGLGLWMTSGIVHKSAGSISVESQAGKGTRFRIFLPVLSHEPEPVLKALARSLEGGGLNGSEGVVVVTSTDLAQQLTEIMTPAGYRLLHAKDGREAVSLAMRVELQIDLLIIDAALFSGNTGDFIDVVIELHPGMRFLVLTANGDDIYNSSHRLRGAALVRQPFEPETLMRRVREALDGPAEAAILIADEDRAIRNFLRHVLQPCGYRVLEASNTRRAGRLIREQRVDALLIDLDTSDQEGMMMLKGALQEKRNVPVIAMVRTALGGHGEDLNASFVIQKPFRAEAVENLVHDVLARHNRRAEP